MGDYGSPRSVRSQEELRALLDEIWALATDGAPEDALRIQGTVPASPSQDPSSELLLARLMLRHGGAEGRAQAARALRAICGKDPEHVWRARLELARLLRRDGKTAEAAAVLKQAVEEFRASSSATSDLAEPLARILTIEAERLHVETMRSSPAAGESAAREASHEESESKTAIPSTPIGTSFLLRLVEFGRRLAPETEPDRALRLILHEAIEFAGAERGFVVVLGVSGLEFAVAENLDRSEIDEPSFEVSRTLIKEVGASGRSAFLSLADLPEHHPMSHSLTSRGVHAVACVPMVASQGTLGVLYLDRRHASGSFGGDRRWLLDLFASQAAAALENARTHARKARELEAARELARRQKAEADRRSRYDTLIGSSEAMQEVFRHLDRIIPTEMPVVILGETGTGKDLVAHVIHERGPRREGPFVALNCAGMSETLIESELFGHEKGAFTGADRARPGLFEVAHRGTLFLDEVGDMSPRMQGELLRVLQSGEVRRIGGRETVRTDVRVIAATHRDLAEKIRRGEFREDLYYRLNVLTLALPPLRERPEDIALLAEEILGSLARGGRAPAISAEAMRRLQAYPWPGNVRQLENVLRRMSVLGGGAIEDYQLPEEIRLTSRPQAGAGTLRQAESEAIQRALEAARGNKAEAARILGVDRKTLHSKMKRQTEP